MKLFLLSVLLWAQALGADWPGVKFEEVRAYYYNDAGAFFIPIIKNGNLNPGVENPEGSLLSREQTDRLLKTLNTKRFEVVEPGCFVPRHAFVFYDAQKNVVATYEVCIHCHTQRGNPAGLAPVTDLDAVVALLVELKLKLEPGYEKEGEWREKWDPSKLVPFDEKKAPAVTHLDLPKPEVPLKVPPAEVRSKKYPAKRFSPWIENDARRYAGTYKNRWSKHSDSASTITLKLTLSGKEWLANGTERMWEGPKPLRSEQKGQIWDEPLRFGKVVSFSQNGLYAYIFCHFRRDDGKVVDGLVFFERFYEKQKQ